MDDYDILSSIAHYIENSTLSSSQLDGSLSNANTTWTFPNSTSSTNFTSIRSTRHVSILGQSLITFFYGFGISANVSALVLLARGETARNRKQTLMVRCLACNDLVALLGSFLLMYMHLYMSEPLVDSRWFCALRVILRTFGLSSGCVAIVMAAERWMALTRPFLYQKVSFYFNFIDLLNWNYKNV